MKIIVLVQRLVLNPRLDCTREKHIEKGHAPVILEPRLQVNGSIVEKYWKNIISQQIQTLL